MTPGQMVAHYRILERIGAGGMGVVYKALDTHLNRTVAIKVLPPESVADPVRRQRFVQEAHAASALDHPNIVTIHDIAESAGQHFIVMQYVEGKSLRALLGRGALPLDDALRHAIQAADALASAHAKGIVHRDLKPENIMVTEAGQVKILDFGLAKLAEKAETDQTMTEGPRPHLTEEGSVVGTAAYMSPEQAQGKRVDARSDIFSFGTVLYEMITGRQPFHADNRLGVLAAIVRDEPEKVSALLPSAPAELEKLIARALRKDPEWRWQSMADMRVALKEIKQESESGATVGAVSAPPQRKARRWIWAVAVPALGLVIGTAAWLRLRRPETAPTPMPPPKTVPLTTFPGLERRASFSPDGNQVAFSWDGEKGGNFDIYIKLVGSSTPLRLTTDPAPEGAPAWSPDGRQIAFRRGGTEGSDILLIPALGGPERKLAATLAGGLAGRLSWSPDGKFLAFPDRSPAADQSGIFLLSTESGEKRIVTKPPVGNSDISPAFSPDGQTLAFARSHGTGAADIHLLSLAAGGAPRGEPTRLTFDDRQIQGVDWAADGRSIVFSSNRAGAQTLWRIPASGGAPERLQPVADGATAPAVSPRGNRLAFVQQVTDTNIWRVGKQTPPARFISSTHEEHYPQYSPDGKRIAFESSRSGSEEIWLCDSEGSNPVQLTTMGSTAKTAHPRWSPDGRRIAFDSSPQGHRDIYVVNVEGGGLPRRLTSEPSEETRASWSRDGRWIYFTSNRTGNNEVWKASPEGGPAMQVTKKGGREPFESPDGKFLYYMKGQPSAIWRMPVGGGEETELVSQAVILGHWALTDQGIFVARPRAEAGPTIEFFRFATNRATPVWVFPKDVRLFSGMGVSPDGRWILYTQIDRVESDLMLIENFR